jgi:hypothetical protein
MNSVFSKPHYNVYMYILIVSHKLKTDEKDMGYPLKIHQHIPSLKQ